MVDMRPYSRKVRRSLLQRELMGGIPQTGLIGLFVMSVVFIYGFSMYFMSVPIILLYLVMRHLTKLDPWLIDIVIDNIQQKDLFVP
ncbi:MAG: VirB3 family type IV secretion system protein [Treponema sp.]|jgi:type IV secretory pathway TrbD component|nr:VirB3 family type IV secretion system protein [Treponema sp.]